MWCKGSFGRRSLISNVRTFMCKFEFICIHMYICACPCCLCLLLLPLFNTAWVPPCSQEFAITKFLWILCCGSFHVGKESESGSSEFSHLKRDGWFSNSGNSFNIPYKFGQKDFPSKVSMVFYLARGFSRRPALKASTGYSTIKGSMLRCGFQWFYTSCTSFVAPIRTLGGFKHPPNKFCKKIWRGAYFSRIMFGTVFGGPAPRPLVSQLIFLVPARVSFSFPGPPKSTKQFQLGQGCFNSFHA